MGEFSSATISALQGLFVKRAVQGQVLAMFETALQTLIFCSIKGGLLTGQDPATYNTSDPLRLWIIQLGIIIMMAQLLGAILGKIKQPRVIAEILGGILLGPTAFGRIPGFTNHIFPASSLPYLSLTANIGLCLFLFIIGLEIDPSIIRRNARLSLTVSIAGVLPFGVGCGMAAALYHQFLQSSINFKYFMVFIGVTYSITAFPVLCRILTALNLLDTKVGLIALSAGVANDVIGWTLLALAVSLVNATTGLTALYVFLTCLAYALFLLFPVKRALAWLARKDGSTVHGPTMLYMTVVMLVLWASAFFTDIVGVNAIFGAFLVGVIVPREGGISLVFVEKLEDMVQIIFLPLYFTISGLNTNLGLLNTGTIWGFVFASATLDFTGKFVGCTLSSKALGFNWREATAVGSLMSCKGLVELIVLNVGLSAKILTQQIFSMFVLEALILTFMTTPLVLLIYPPKHRTYGMGDDTSSAASRSDIEGKDLSSDSGEVGENEGWRKRFTVVLDEFQHMPGIMALTKLLVPPASEDLASPDTKPKKTAVHALRLVELSERTSTLIKSAMGETLIRTDPLVGVFKMFGEQSDMPISASLSVVSQNEWAHAVADHARRHLSQLILIPWIPPSFGSTADPSEPGSTQPRGARPEHNPFDTFFGISSKDNSASTLYSHFVRGIFRHSKTDVALFVDMGDNAGTNGDQHVLFPFFGGPDDRLALELVVQLCANSRISATVIRVGKKSEPAGAAKSELGVIDEKMEVDNAATLTLSVTFPNTVYGKPNTTYLLQSDTADDLTWGRFASTPAEDIQPQLRSALSRIKFTDIPDSLALHALVQHARQLREPHRRLLVVAGRSKRFVRPSVRQELKQLVEEHSFTEHEMVRNTIGDVATAFLAAAGAQNGVIVVQAIGETE